MINRIKEYLKEAQENYIENDLFRVVFGLFIMSVSFLIAVSIPEEFKDIGTNIVLFIFAGSVITISGLLPIIIRLILKVLKAALDSKWYVSIMPIALFMSLILSLVSYDVYSSLLYIVAKTVFMFCIIWLVFYLTFKIAAHIDEETMTITVKKTKPKKSHRQKNKTNRLNRKRGRV
ncbi:hypothetical protein [Kosakonia sp. S42]|uniref:hypothetical protein n=1 Tax=Kosakonia sp. S42 TaxID=2767458 RepID=UPI00190DB7ED|nr:hypothetical protein [Kosakonia sp. S42]MBK0019128.1 hypothetical protein [Kosakonia sp. S42]